MTTETASLIVKVSTQGIDQAAAGLNKVSAAGDKAEKSGKRVSSAFSELRGAMVAIGGLALANNIIKDADAYQNLHARLTLATGSAEQAAVAYRQLLEITRASHADLQETGNLYAKLAQSTKSLGLDQSQLLSITDSVGKALRISGAGAQETESSIRQLGQAFASGLLRGDEFNSIMENAPRLAQAMADSLGVTRGELRKMAADGQITSQAMASAFLGQAKKISEEFQRMPETVGTVMQDIRNEMFDAFGQTSTGPLVDSMKELREVLKDPQVKEGIETLASGMVRFFGAIAAGAADFAQFGKDLGFLMAKISGNLDPIDELDQKIRNLQEGLKGDLFHQGSGKHFFMSKEELQADIDALEQQKQLILEARGLSGSISGPAAATQPTSMPQVTAEKLAQAAADEKRAEKLGDYVKKLQEQGATAGMTAREIDIYKANMLGAGDAERSAINNMHDLIDAAEQYKKQIEDRKAIDDYLANLQSQADTVGMNAVQLERYKLAQMGATEQDIAAAEALQRKVSLYNVEQEMMTEQERALQAYVQRRDMIMQSTTGDKQAGLMGKLSGQLSGQMSDFGQDKSNSIDDQMAQLQKEYDMRREVVLSNEALIESEKQTLLGEMQQGYLAKMQQFEDQKMQMQFSNTAAMFDGLAGLAKTFGGEQSKAYKTLFAASKAFSIAQATMSMFTGIAKGVELGWPAMIPAIAAATAQGTSALAGVKGQNFAGAFDKGGFIPAGSVGLVGEIGPELVTGPATVTGREQTAAMSGKGGNKIAIFNVWDRAMIESLKNSDDFDEVVINALERNRQRVKQAVG
jgi:tape measure domain-containing protein